MQCLHLSGRFFIRIFDSDLKQFIIHLVLWHCWLGERKDMQSVKKPALTMRRSSQNRDSLLPANPGLPGMIAVKMERQNS